MSAFMKDLFREIKNTSGRFLSILIITALGAASIVGIQAAAIDMRDVADKLYKEHNLYDLQLKSATGFGNDDISALWDTYGVSAVMPTYIYDVFIDFSGEIRTARTYALPDGINEISIKEGRMPENDSECLVEENMLLSSDYRLRGNISFKPDNADDYMDIFVRDTFTIVGIVSSPLYISDYERGNTSIGDGSLDYYMYLHPDAYVLDVFTDVYILMEDARKLDNLSGEYYTAADQWKTMITQTGDMQVSSKIDELTQAARELEDGWKEYFDSLSLYESLPEAAKTEDMAFTLKEHRKDLEEAQEIIDNAPEPEWFYFVRKDGVAFDSYYNDTLRLQKIGYVFPLVFYIVAVMVSLTSMSRMVDEHRTQIGIYKALGYRPAAIMMKYFIYAFSASFIGGIFGVLVGSQLFPSVISEAYGHLYNMPPVDKPVPILIGILAVASAVVIVVAVTLGTCAGSLTGVPAQLMRPKPPSSGRRVFLERFPCLWKRFGFFGKVTARNIFRYKKRFFMTLFGIAGCSALLLTAFGLRDSISGIAGLQYESVFNYDIRAYLKELTSQDERSDIDSLLSEPHLYFREENVRADNWNISLMVPENAEKLNSFINLHSFETGEYLTLEDDSVLITDKLADALGIYTGSTITITTGEGKSYTAAVTGVVENYVLHYIYMSPGIYTSLFGEEAYPNGLLAISENGRDLSQALLSSENVRAVVYNSDLLLSLGDSTAAMDVVTVVLIVLACSLALVVLFNLTNINITERIRELATIKVLGFYDSELAVYVYRENAIVTLMGIIFGLAGGILLHRFVLSTVEIDLLRFPIIIKPESYLIAVLLSASFAVFVNIVMNYRLARIDMVESLKNVE